MKHPTDTPLQKLIRLFRNTVVEAIKADDFGPEAVQRIETLYDATVTLLQAGTNQHPLASGFHIPTWDVPKSTPSTDGAPDPYRFLKVYRAALNKFVQHVNIVCASSSLFVTKREEIMEALGTVSLAFEDVRWHSAELPQQLTKEESLREEMKRRRVTNLKELMVARLTEKQEEARTAQQVLDSQIGTMFLKILNTKPDVIHVKAAFNTTEEVTAPATTDVDFVHPTRTDDAQAEKRHVRSLLLRHGLDANTVADILSEP